MVAITYPDNGLRLQSGWNPLDWWYWLMEQGNILCNCDFQYYVLQKSVV